jgi:hypothetical protein
MNGSERAGVGPQLNTSKIAFGIATVLVGMAFLGSGIANLMHAPHIAADMARLGYPASFRPSSGRGRFSVPLPFLGCRI